jgi:hypothetical protein
MDVSDIESTPEAEAIHIAGQLWNALLKVDGLDSNDILVANENVHRIQDMLYTSLFIKLHGKL